MQLYRKVQEKEEGASAITPLLGSRWEAPPTRVFKVNWDIAIVHTVSCMGVGVMIQDDKGLIIAALSKPIIAIHERTTTEAIAALTI